MIGVLLFRSEDTIKCREIIVILEDDPARIYPRAYPFYKLYLDPEAQKVNQLIYHPIQYPHYHMAKYHPNQYGHLILDDHCQIQNQSADEKKDKEYHL